MSMQVASSIPTAVIVIQGTQLYPKLLLQWLFPLPTPKNICTVCYEYYVKNKKAPPFFGVYRDQPTQERH
jgi:hypothetical protein